MFDKKEDVDFFKKCFEKFKQLYRESNFFVLKCETSVYDDRALFYKQLEKKLGEEEAQEKEKSIYELWSGSSSETENDEEKNKIVRLYDSFTTARGQFSKSVGQDDYETLYEEQQVKRAKNCCLWLFLFLMTQDDVGTNREIWPWDVNDFLFFDKKFYSAVQAMPDVEYGIWSFCLCNKKYVYNLVRENKDLADDKLANLVRRSLEDKPAKYKRGEFEKFLDKTSEWDKCREIFYKWLDEFKKL